MWMDVIRRVKGTKTKRGKCRNMENISCYGKKDKAMTIVYHVIERCDYMLIF